MDWLLVTSCSDAYRFGWLIGNASGLYALIVIVILIVTAPAYHPDVPLAVSKTTRTWSQRVLFVAQLLLFFAWLFGGKHVGGAFLACYITSLCLAAMTVIAPVMLLLMFTSANWVGRASAR